MATDVTWGSKQTATAAQARRYLGFGVHSNRTATGNDRTSRYRVSRGSCRLCELHCEWQKRSGTVGTITFGIDRLDVDGNRTEIATVEADASYTGGNQTVRKTGLDIALKAGDRLSAWVRGNEGLTVSPLYLQVQAVIR